VPADGSSNFGGEDDVDIEHEHLGAFAGVRAGDLGSNATCCSGDHSALPSEASRYRKGGVVAGEHARFRLGDPSFQGYP
jgi:hypothetical protein